MELRGYQLEIVEDVRYELATHKRVILQLPTGGGKTVIAANIIERAIELRNRVAFLVHRKELIDQAHQTFSSMGIPVGVVAPGYTPSPLARVQLCSILALGNRIDDLIEPDLIIIDEAHHTTAPTWRRVLDTWEDAHVIGLTATPQRLDGTGLDDIFSGLVCGPQTSQLIEQGSLAEFRLFSPPPPDLSDVGTVAGEYNSRQLAEAVDRPALVGNMVELYREHADGKKAILFAAGVAHSEHCAEQLNDAGIRACHIDAKTPKAERTDLLRAFADGEYDVVCNVALFSEGFDLSANAGKDVVVECVIGMRPTQSLTICLQQWGRALRPQSGKAVILDMAGNYQQHGSPSWNRTWTLAGRKKKPGDDISVSICGQCFLAMPQDSRECPECGWVRPIRKRRELDHDEDGELVEITDDRAAEDERRAKEEADARTIDDWRAIAERRGYDPKWAAYRHHAKRR